jgi:type II secretory pathway pseudopilin PulG
MISPVKEVRERGISLVEIVVVLTIVAALVGLAIATLSGTKRQDNVDRAAEVVYQDLIQMRSKAISTGKTHRLRWTSDTQWLLELYDDTLSTPAWVQMGPGRQMPSDTYLMSGSLVNAGSNLEATSRGIFQFQNGKTGTPYITIEGLGVSRTKSFYVYTGGAIEIKTP